MVKTAFSTSLPSLTPQRGYGVPPITDAFFARKGSSVIKENLQGPIFRNFVIFTPFGVQQHNVGSLLPQKWRRDNRKNRKFAIFRPHEALVCSHFQRQFASNQPLQAYKMQIFQLVALKNKQSAKNGPTKSSKSCYSGVSPVPLYPLDPLYPLYI